MSQVTAMILQCLSSGAILTSLCAAIVVPPLTWLGVRVLSPSISAMRDDRRWQSNAAAAAAALPGALFLVLVSVGMAEGVKSPCLQLTAGKGLYGLLAAFIVGAIARSVLRAYRRDRDVRAMLAGARAAQGKAAVIAEQVGVALFEIEDDRGMVVLVAGTPRPGVYVSRAALREFAEAELRAALFHERAHMERGDHHIAPWLYFLTDLLPLPMDDLIGVYRCSREFCADACALSHVERTDLASALLRVARGTAPSLGAAAAFAERDAIYGRLDALLRPQREVTPNLYRRAAVTATIVLIGVLGSAAPAVAAFVSHCGMVRLLS